MDLQEFATAAAVLHDTADAEGMVLDLDRLAHMMTVIGAGKNVVHNHIIRPLKGRPATKTNGFSALKVA